MMTLVIVLSFVCVTKSGIIKLASKVTVFPPVMCS